jgi:hypothetical protein
MQLKTTSVASVGVVTHMSIEFIRLAKGLGNPFLSTAMETMKFDFEWMLVLRCLFLSTVIWRAVPCE